MGKRRKGPKDSSPKEGETGAAEIKPGESQKNPLHGYVRVLELECEAFENYYKAQEICDSAVEFETFMASCKEGLPCGVRVNGTLGKQGQRVWMQFQSLLALPSEEQWNSEHLKEADAGAKMDVEAPDDGSLADAAAPSKQDDPKPESTPAYILRPKPLQWYPRQLAYQWDHLNGKTIRKDDNFKWLKAFLMHHETYGAIQRQETVSMIPPFFLDVQKDDLVLDMCAAPGSKTCQMLERLHWDAQTDGSGEFSLSKGGVLANDVEWKRANMLTHQVQRIGSPGIGVLNTDAQYFPAMKRKDGSILRFDKVLCDVPCSGDGTIRKSPNLWRTWKLADGMGLHFRQLGILWRGLDLLKVGGRLVYSTCSLNPMENESVINAILEKCDGTIQLVEPPAGLASKDGKTHWRVSDLSDPNETQFFESWDAVPASVKETNKVRATMFPPAHGSKNVEQIQRCCRRFLPHLMNTGGFFVTIIEKKAELPHGRDARRVDASSAAVGCTVADAKLAKKETQQQMDQPTVETKTEAEGEPPAKKLKSETVEPVLQPVQKKEEGESLAATKKPAAKDDLIPLCMEDWQMIQECYGLPDSARAYFFTRPKVNGTDKIFGISEKMQDAVACCQNSCSTKVMACGVRTFADLKSFGGKCPWRITQQGVLLCFALGMSEKRVVKISKSFLVQLLEKRDLPTQEVVQQLADNFNGCQDERNKLLLLDESTGEPKRVEDDSNHVVVNKGSFILYNVDTEIKATVLISRKTLTLYVDKQESAALLACLKIGDDLKAEMGL